MKKRRNTVIIVASVLLLFDQIVKIWIKTHMTLGESIKVFGDWFYIRFIENPGAAWGFQIGGQYGKLILSLGRIGLIALLVWYLRRLIKQNVNMGVVIGFTLIFVGAVGNMIDCAFYGLLFGESTFYEVAQFMPEGGGYAGFLYGNVVDMLHFPLFSGTYPNWFPWIGGGDFTFFSPIFNVADSCITVGMLYLIIFQSKFFK